TCSHVAASASRLSDFNGDFIISSSCIPAATLCRNWSGASTEKIESEEPPLRQNHGIDARNERLVELGHVVWSAGIIARHHRAVLEGQSALVTAYHGILPIHRSLT